VPETSLFEVEIDIGELKIYKSPGNYQISTELIKAAQQWKKLITILTHKVGDKTECNNYR
jgi:hypothetical protein